MSGGSPSSAKPWLSGVPCATWPCEDLRSPENIACHPPGGAALQRVSPHARRQLGHTVQSHRLTVLPAPDEVPKFAQGLWTRKDSIRSVSLTAEPARQQEEGMSFQREQFARSLAHLVLGHDLPSRNDLGAVSKKCRRCSRVGMREL